MKKFVHLIHRDALGGGEKVIAQHLEHFGKRWETWVLHGGRGLITETCERLGIKEVQLPIDSKWKCLFGFFLVLWNLIRIKPDIVVVHGQWSGPLGALATRLLGIRRCIYYVHWPSFYTDWDLFRINRNFIAEWIPVHFSSRLVMVSEASRYQYMIRFPGVEKKTVVLSNMVDLNRVPTAAEVRAIREKYGWDSSRVNVVSVGRMSTQKRIDWLIESWKQVQEANLPAHLWIVGDGELLEEMKALASARGINRTCTFLGSQPQGIHFLGAADVVAMTTMYETNSLVPMEAMACGRPIVANSVDGVRDTFTDGREGFLVAPGKTDLFADRLMTLIKDAGLREEMGRRGRERARDFATDVVLDRYAAFIEEELTR